MRGFIVVWLVAFGVVTLFASGITWYVARNTPPPTPVVIQPATNAESDLNSNAPFPESAALEIISRRLPLDAAGDLVREKLQTSSTVTYHSARHWRVCIDTACWVAHGPGRYAEPENEAARQHEAGAATPAR
jgi:hypothetical protein